MEHNTADALKPLEGYAPVPWDMIPDFGLYMDQVITFINKMLEPLFGANSDGCLSSSMINNYVKAKLIPRPTGKKYSREQIALLTMIAILKQVSAMDDIRAMLEAGQKIGTEKLYTGFFRRQLGALHALSGAAEDDPDLPPALDFAITASAFRTGCEFMLRG